MYLNKPASTSACGRGVETGVRAGVAGTDTGPTGKLLLLFPSSVDTEAASDSAVVLCTLLLLSHTKRYAHLKQNKRVWYEMSYS